MFEDFFGNSLVTRAIERIVRRDRIPQTLLFHGPEGVGKATLARRLAAALLGGADRIERDDLSRPENVELVAEREKWPSERRAEEPLLFASHPDFLTFPPDGPLRQLSIQQIRLLKDRAQFKPLHGSRRVFLIDHLDRANESAANSLLKTLEEPPDHMVLLLTAENPYDLLPTIRSRAVQFQLSPLSPEEMAAFVRRRGLDQPERRVALSGGCPGAAVSLDLEKWERRRESMVALLAAASRTGRFSEWAVHAEKLAADRNEKLDALLIVLYSLLEDLVFLKEGQDHPRSADIPERLAPVAESVSFDWIREAVRKADALMQLVRRNVQKTMALDALVLELRDRAV